MRNLMFTPFLMFTLLTSLNAYADDINAAAIVQKSDFSLAIETAQVAAHIAQQCGPTASRYFISAVKSQESSVAIANNLSTVSKNPACAAALREYRIVSTEIYRRTHAAIANNPRAQLVLPKLDPQNITNSINTAVNAPEQIKIASQNSAIVQLNGLNSSAAPVLVLFVAKDGDDKPMFQLFAAPANSAPWSQRVILRRGDGTYHIRLGGLQALPTAGQTFHTEVYGDVTVAGTNLPDPTTLPSSSVQSDDPTIITLTQTIIAGITDDIAKAKAIHDWMADNITYDYTTLNALNAGQSFESANMGQSPSALLTLKKKTGICEEYAYLAAALLRAARVPAKVIYGQTARGAHAWNQALVAGHWIEIDTTWDAGRSDAEYFAPAEEVFRRDHTATEDSGL